jgi:hypothetical protein
MKDLEPPVSPFLSRSSAVTGLFDSRADPNPRFFGISSAPGKYFFASAACDIPHCPLKAGMKKKNPRFRYLRKKDYGKTVGETERPLHSPLVEKNSVSFSSIREKSSRRSGENRPSVNLPGSDMSPCRGKNFFEGISGAGRVAARFVQKRTPEKKAYGKKFVLSADCVRERRGFFLGKVDKVRLHTVSSLSGMSRSRRNPTR